ncbi:MAG: family 2A encapsulin nanocompartment cargo protein cysteine desulfurase [Polyangiaceae bacterium]
MSTPDPSGAPLLGALPLTTHAVPASAGLPAEAQFASGMVPQPAHAADAVIAPGSTPGLALAATRLPGGPTHPEPDPSSLSLVLARYANAAFGPVATPSMTSSELHASPPAPSVPGTPSLVLPGLEPAVPSSPFLIAPTFEARHLELGRSSHDAAIPLVDPPAQRLDLPTVEGAPWWLDTERELRRPPATRDLPLSERPEIEGIEPRSLPRAEVPRSAPGAFDAHAVRREFPILEERVHGKRLVWLDNAATTQKPRAVIERIKLFYERENSNIHRAAHTLAARATDAYEGARETTRKFLNAPSKNEIIFVRGTTEGINLVAQTYGRRHVEPGDEVLITWLEHHANIVPWQRLCDEKGAKLKVAPVDDRGQIKLEEFEKLLGPRTRLVSISQVSNALGTITPAKQMIDMAHRHGARVLLDGAQAVSHMPIDVQALDCDFFVFSGHKVFAPTGIGAVYGKKEVLEEMPPWQGGGNMIQDVTFEKTLYQGPPWKFEAGTGNIADAVGMGAALDWLMRLGVENVGRYEHELLAYGTEQLARVPGLTMIGTAPDKAGVLSFILAGQKTEEVGGMLDKEGIAVRSGHHCAQPILRRFGLEATVRASLAPYNTCEDIDALVAALMRLQAGHVEGAKR